MGTAVNTTSAGQGLVSAEELSRMLMESSTRKAPVAAKPRKRPEEEAIPDTSVEEAALPVKDEGEATDEAPEKEGAAAAEDESGDPYAEVDSGGSLAAASDEPIELAQAPSGAAAVVKPAAVAAEDEGAAAALPLWFFGGAALGFAALDDDGGGSSAPAPTVTVSSPGPIEDFADFHAQAGGVAPDEVTATSDSGLFVIHDGFDRALLPDTLANLEEHLVYDLNLEEDAVDFHGLQVNLEGGANAFVLAAAAASGTTEEDGAADSDIVWLANLGAVGQGITNSVEPTGDGFVEAAFSDLEADAAVGGVASAQDGGDAEVGISNLYVDLAGTGDIAGTAFLGAFASGEAHAAAYVGNDMLVNVSADVGAVDGEVGIESVSGGANAAVSFISASASHDSTAQISIGGDVQANADTTGSGGAYASIDDIDADAENHSTASIFIGGDVQANAVAAEGAAYAEIDDIEADAYSFAVAQVSVAGDVSAIAMGGTYASATVESITAEAAFGSIAEISIGGSVVANAVATAGGASASVSSISASASFSSEARVSIDGDVAASANGTSYASASIESISAYASDGTAEISIGGSVLAAAVANSGEASASVSEISASAYAGGNALVSIGGDVAATAMGHTYASAEVESISAYAFAGETPDAVGSTAQVLIGGSVLANATATDGGAYASISSISASAGTHSLAQISIGSDVSANAAGVGWASAYVSDISADAYGGTAEVLIGGSVLAKAVASGAEDTGSDGEAELTEVTNGVAHASVSEISASAYYGGNALVSIGGDVSANAVGTGWAEATVDSIEASAYAGISEEDPGSTAQVLIDGCVHAHATASEGGAYASVTNIEAEAGFDSLARVVIGSDVDITAKGEWAAAYGASTDSDGFIEANASWGGTALVSIGGSVMADADASDGNATASMADLSANVYFGGEATVSVAGDVSASAAGTSGADAEIDFVGANVSYGGSASLLVAGSVLADAAASVPDAEGPTGWASASIDNVSASAYAGGNALVSIGGDVSASAAGDAYADADVGIRSYAGGGASTARVAIGGNVVVTAAGASASADLFVGASGEGEIEITGDINLSVSASDEAYIATASGSIVAWNSASIKADDINLSVMGSSSFGNLDIEAYSSAAIVVDDIVVTVDGGASAQVDVHAYGSSEIWIGDVTASVGEGGKVSFDIGQIAGDAATDADRTATLTGAGDVYMELDDQIFGEINVADLDGDFDLVLNLGDDDTSSVPFTVINGFSADSDSLMYNYTWATADNFTHVGTFTDAGALFTELGLALDGNDQYAFAVYTGVDITGDGVDEAGLGVLAYDMDGAGMTSVLYLTGITELSPEDLGNGGLA